MDSTLNQLLNDLLLTQAENRNLRAALEAAQAEHANCPKPEPAPAAPEVSSEAKAPVDNPAPSGDSA